MVPLMMPAIHSMRLAVRPSRSALMIGMPPATAASKATITPLSLRRGEDLVAVHRQQRLVGGDHVLAGGDGLQHQLLRDAVAADQLDDDVDVRDWRSPANASSVDAPVTAGAADQRVLSRDHGDADRRPARR